MITLLDNSKFGAYHLALLFWLFFKFHSPFFFLALLPNIFESALHYFIVSKYGVLCVYLGCFSMLLVAHV